MHVADPTFAHASTDSSRLRSGIGVSLRSRGRGHQYGRLGAPSVPPHSLDAPSA
jgi:hypothetical protein